MKKFCFICFFFSIVSLGCSTSEFVKKNTVIMFDTQNYSNTIPSNIKIYNSRLEIPSKYFEIGVIKAIGSTSKEELKILASEKGAMAIITEENNYILIRFFNKKGKDKNGYKKI